MEISFSPLSLVELHPLALAEELAQDHQTNSCIYLESAVAAALSNWILYSSLVHGSSVQPYAKFHGHTAWCGYFGASSAL